MENNSYITIDDFALLFRSLEDDEMESFETKASHVSDILRQEAINVGKDLDEMIANKKVLPTTVKEVTSAALARWIMQPTDYPTISDSTDGFDPDISFNRNTNVGIFLKRDELKRLGLKRQRIITLKAGDEDE